MTRDEKDRRPRTPRTAVDLLPWMLGVLVVVGIGLELLRAALG